MRRFLYSLLVATAVTVVLVAAFSVVGYVMYTFHPLVGMALALFVAVFLFAYFDSTGKLD